ncbi:MAG TPA: hypothetical protein VLG45_02510 [Thermodesulfobacteriota bacterium]|nr:hypothetical protein [Thermodesulfobacteriota bacterium]
MGGVETYTSYMSWKTVVGLIIVIVVIFGISKLFGHLSDKRDASTSYLEETVQTSKKVRQLKEERSRLIEDQEKSLLDEE